MPSTNERFKIGTLFIFKDVFLQMTANDLFPYPAELGGFLKYA